MPMISIIVPVYNVEKYLCRCLDSIQAQIYKNFEVILLDDGSTDRSYNIMSKYAEEDKRIKIYKYEHQGVAFVRKKGIELAEGEYIGFVDSDDWIEPDMYARLYETMRNNKCDLVSVDVYGHYENGHDAILYDNYDKQLYTNLINDIYPSMLHDFSRNTKGLLCFLVSKLFRADILKSVIGDIETRVFYGEDAMIFYRYCLACQSIYIMREPFYHYDIHSGSAETKPNPKEPENMYGLFCNLKEAFETSSYRDVLMPQLYQYAILLNNRVLRGLYGIDLGGKNAWFFPEIEKLYGNKIVIYGAGACGQAMQKELWLHGHAGDVVAIVDKNHDKVKMHVGETASEFVDGLKCKVQPVSFIKEINYDYLIVAIYNKFVAEEAIEELQENWEISKEKIIWLKAYKKNIASILSSAYL